jgi:hypothetical protein
MADFPDPQELVRRYLDLWQQHLTQTATDPELAEGMAKLIRALPAAVSENWPAWTETYSDENTPNGTPASGTAPDGNNVVLDEFILRLDALEKRLDTLEQKPVASRRRTSKGSGKN